MPRSAADLIEDADRLLGYGGQHRQVMRHLYEDGDDVFPRFAVKANGYELVDAEGRSFIDWMSAGGPVLLGYGNAVVERAIQGQLNAGPTLSLMHPVELEVAALLTELIPSAEMVAFGKNGSDVVTGAVRVARAVTGKRAILQCGVHGFHDWYVAKFPEIKGVPDELRTLLHPFPYNDLDALGELFDRLSGDVAAVVMEPVTIEPPKAGYLEGVRQLTRKHGALLVFDEMLTGFRLANGGAQQLYGVTPDLTCLGKAIANGMPLSALVGSRRHMKLLPEVAYGMTFRGETLSLAAAKAVLHTLKEQPVAGRLAETGSRLREAFRSSCAQEHVGADLVGPSARMSFDFWPAAGLASERLRTIFVRECARQGVLTNGNILPSLAHDERAIERTAPVFAHALRTVSGLAEKAGEAVTEAIRVGFLAGERPRDSDSEAPDGMPDGFFEVLEERAGHFELRGWLLLPDGPADSVEVFARGGATLTADRMERADLARAFPNTSDAARGGFTAVLPEESFSTNGSYDFVIRAVREDRTVFLSRILSDQPRALAERDPPRWVGDGTLCV